MFKNNTRTIYSKLESQAFITAGLSHCPTLSLNNTSIIFTYNVQAFLCKVGIDFDCNKVAASTPSKDYSKFISNKDKTKIPNQVMNVKGVNYTILLQEKVQIRTITNIQCELLIEELYLKGIIVHPKELITQMKEILISHEHPSPNSDVVAKKYFTLCLLMATYQSRDVLEQTLVKISKIHCSRVQLLVIISLLIAYFIVDVLFFILRIIHIVYEKTAV